MSEGTTPDQELDIFDRMEMLAVRGARKALANDYRGKVISFIEVRAMGWAVMAHAQRDKITDGQVRDLAYAIWDEFIAAGGSLT